MEKKLTVVNNKSMKSATALRTIGEASELLDVPQHVLRFWETKFDILKPVKTNGRRYYSAKDLESFEQIKTLLYEQGYTIKGAIQYFASSKANKNSTNEIVLDDFPFEAAPRTIDTKSQKEQLRHCLDNLYKLRQKLFFTLTE